MADKKNLHVEIPLLKDHHNHLSLYALLSDCLNLGEIKSKMVALEKLSILNKEKISVVIGWNSGYYNFEKEEMALLPPVVIVNLSLHSFLLSPLAEQMLQEKYPEIVANYSDPEWYEDHMPQMLIFLANLMEVSSEKFENFFNELYKKGIYYVEEMHLPNETVFTVLKKTSLFDRTAFWTDLITFKTLSSGIQGEIRGIKFFTDGAVGACTAALDVPFINGRKGNLLFDDESLFENLAEAASFQKGIAIHAIGELATAQVVRVLKRLKANGLRFPLIRMEHCQFIHESVAKEAKELGIILSMQPNFSTDSLVYTDRLCTWYLENNNPFRMLIDKIGFTPGENLIFGSDGMPNGFEAALTASLFPPYSIQQLTLDEFIAGYCMKDKSVGYLDVKISENGLDSFTVVPGIAK